MLSQLHGRRTVLTALITAGALLGFSASASAAVTIDPTSTGYNADSTVGNPSHRTLNRSATVDFTVTNGGAAQPVTCALDGAAPVTCGTTTGAGPDVFSPGFATGTLALGVHELVVSSVAGGTATYVWRIEPPKYQQLVTKSSPGSSALAYWNLDDAHGSDIADDSSTGGLYDAEYKNYVVQRQAGIPACEEQPGAPHSPWACDWLGVAADSPFDSLDTNLGNSPSGRDTKGYSAWFSGRDDHIQIENMPNSTGDWSVELWARPQFEQETRGLWDKQQSIWAKPYDASSMQFSCSNVGPNGNKAVSDPIANATFNGGRFHVVCSYTGGQYRISVNDNPGTSAAGYSQNSGAHQGFIGMTNGIGANIWWKGYIDDVAYYNSALSADAIAWHHQTGTVADTKYGASFLTIPGDDVAPPSQSTIGNSNNAQYSADAFAKGYHADPVADFQCTDVQADGSTVGIPESGGVGTFANNSCYAEESQASNMSSPELVLDGGTLPQEPGVHYLRLTAVDADGNRYQHTHQYYVHGPSTGFRDMIGCTGLGALSPAFLCDSPLAYYRFNEADDAPAMLDETANDYDGEYKNDAYEGGTGGVSGDANPRTRKFFGQGGYASVNNIAAPRTGYTIALWWKPKDNGDMMLFQHGSNGAIYVKDGAVKFRPDERSTSVASFPVTVPANGSAEWYYVAATYDGIEGKLYVEKSLAATNALATPAKTLAEHWQDGANSADTLYLGYGDQLGGNGWLRGELDEVVYYGTVLSQSKLTEHYLADPPAGDVTYSARSSSPAAAVSSAATARAAAAKKARAMAKARAKAKAKARAKAAKKAKARAKARVKARARAKAKRRS